MTENSCRRDPLVSLFPCLFQFICCSLPSKSNAIGKELQQRKMLTSFHRTLDDGWWSCAKSTVEKYVVVQVMELHDESEEESREPSPGVQRCVNNGTLKGVHLRRGNEDRPEHFKFALRCGNLVRMSSMCKQHACFINSCKMGRQRQEQR